MVSLLCLGFGYSARCFVAAYRDAFATVVGTVRAPGKGAVPAAGFDKPVRMIVFDGETMAPDVAASLAQASVILVSIPPSAADELAVGQLQRARPLQLTTIIYLSTVGVYGDHGGAWVDETTAPRPTTDRGMARLAAERAWQDLGQHLSVPVTVLRLAGIYGCGRNALVNLAERRARPIIKPGQVFNRIHVLDLAQVIAAAIRLRAGGIFNVADDEPAPPQDVIAFAAALAGIAPPAPVSFAEAVATLSPMARSFYADNRRVRNAKLKSALGVMLCYPTYREGLVALYEAGEFRGGTENAAVSTPV